MKERPRGRKSAKRQAGRRERHLRKLLNLVADAALATVNGRVRYANRAAVGLLGAPASGALKGLVYEDLVMAREALPDGAERHTLRRLDGATTELTATTSGRGAVRRIVLRPVSDADGEEPFLLVAESVRDRAMITLDTDGNILQWNDAARRITGVSGDDIIGRPLGAVGAPEKDAVAEAAGLLREAREVGRAEHEGWKTRDDGSQYYAAVSVTPLFDRDRALTGYAVLLRDLTSGSAYETLQSDEQVRQAQRMEAVGRLASGIAHDFNNLLTAIHGHAQFLLEDLADNDPSRVDAEEILHSADRAAALTRQLLSFSRGRAAQPQAIDLNHVVQSVDRLLRRLIAENIELVTMLDTAVWPVRADPGHIEQVLVNLAVNAGDAMPAGGTLTIKTANTELTDRYGATRGDVKPGRYAMLAVSDTGVGMDVETQAHIFEPFFTTKQPGQGTGLGLSTVYGIVRQSGGHVFVYSEPGKGTTFKIYLPYAGGIVQTHAAQLEDVVTARNVEKLLVVEDDAGVRALARRALEARGYEVVVAASGQQALEELEKAGGTIALVLSDVVLQDTTGTELAETISTMAPHCKLILMSGYTEQDIERQGRALNAAFIEKPFTPDALTRKVREVLDS